MIKTAPPRAIENLIDHYVYVIDMSASMLGVARYVVRVVDELIAFLAEQSRTRNRETRITVYVFNSRANIRCIIYDKDVLRMPSVAGFYKPDATTALIDATLTSIADAELIPQRHGDHSFFLTVLTDGKNNDSRGTAEQLHRKLTLLPDNWTYVIFVPDQACRGFAIQFGFPEGNIAIWDAATAEGVAAGAAVMRTITMTHMDNRAAGIRGSRAVFRAEALTTQQVQRILTPVTQGAYEIFDVGPTTRRIDEFAREKTGRYDIGHWHYQFVKPEKVQAYKRVLVLDRDGNLYSGPEARQMLGLPDHDQQVNPAQHGDVTIFVQSTAPNRSLLAGTKTVMFR
jgi:hypothetical protein